MDTIKNAHYRLDEKNQNHLFKELIKNFNDAQVLESRQFDLLLGHIQPDGVRTPGLVDRFNGQGVEAQHVIFFLFTIAFSTREKKFLEI